MNARSPGPVVIDTHQAVPVDVEQIAAQVTFDVAGAQATVDAQVDFVLEGYDGRPLLDLRQPSLDALVLDGAQLPTGHFSPVDVGGGPEAEMRVLRADLAARSRHRLELRYQLTTPAAQGAEPIGWTGRGVRWDLWMSDLYPGRYLEMWLPANLCHDRFALTVDLAVTGTATPHALITNGDAGSAAVNRWHLTFPATFTSLSPMLVLRPTDELEIRRRDVDGRQVVTAKVVESDADLGACEADVIAWLAHNERRYGAYVHGSRFTSVLWTPGRGMEYDGATTAAVAALEHEVFHSWFGRGVKPATASDGWIDEAWTSWATGSRGRRLPRYPVEELPPTEPPVTLYPPSPWSRRTPIESYQEGSRLFAGIAHLLGGAPELRQQMAAFYQGHAGAFVTTQALQDHLGPTVKPLFDRYVHGKA